MPAHDKEKLRAEEDKTAIAQRETLPLPPGEAPREHHGENPRNIEIKSVRVRHTYYYRPRVVPFSVLRTIVPKCRRPTTSKPLGRDFLLLCFGRHMLAILSSSALFSPSR